MSDYLDPDVCSRVSGHADSTFGRYIVSARHNHFVSDGRVSQGAPGEAVFAGELLLASLVSCGLGLVFQSAIDGNEPKPEVELTAEFLQNSEDPTCLAYVDLLFRRN